jgi:preprotein translocase subunit SecG
MTSDRGDLTSIPSGETDSDQPALPRWGRVYGEAPLFLFFGLLGGFLAWAAGFSARLVLGLLFVGLVFSVVLVVRRMVQVGRGEYSEHPKGATRRSTLDRVASAVVTAVTLILAFLWILGAFPSFVRAVNRVVNGLLGG